LHGGNDRPLRRGFGLLEESRFIAVKAKDKGVGAVGRFAHSLFVFWFGFKLELSLGRFFSVEAAGGKLREEFGIFRIYCFVFIV
jgi:hypothetical protein